MRSHCLDHTKLELNKESNDYNKRRQNCSNVERVHVYLNNNNHREEWIDVYLNVVIRAPNGLL